MGASIEKTFLPPFRYSEQFYYFFNVNNIGMQWRYPQKSAKQLRKHIQFGHKGHNGVKKKSRRIYVFQANHKRDIKQIFSAECLKKINFFCLRKHEKNIFKSCS